MNIGDEVIYNGDYGEFRKGVLTAIGSDQGEVFGLCLSGNHARTK